MSRNGEKTVVPRRVWLLSIPRSGSHLLTKILSKQSKLSYSGYNFNNYIFTHHKLLDEDVTLDKLPHADRDLLLEAAKEGLAQTQKVVDELEAKVCP